MHPWDSQNNCDFVTISPKVRRNGDARKKSCSIEFMMWRKGMSWHTGMDDVLDALVIPGYSRIGFAVRSRGWLESEGQPLLGRTVVVTGHTSGIGLATARQLRAHGAHLVLVGRDAQRTSHAANTVREADGPGSVDAFVADMGEPDDIRHLCDEVRERFANIDVLVHNAGALLKTRSRNSVGDDGTLAVHVYGPHLMTSLLMPCLERSRGRVITVSSGGMYAMPIPDVVAGRTLEIPDDRYDGTKQYAIAKRVQVTLNEMWARRPEAGNVSFHAMHPGWVDTPGVATSIPMFRAVTRPILRSSDQGADTIAWLCRADLDDIGNGGFWCDRRKRPIHRLPATKKSDSPAVRDLVWKLVERHAFGDVR